MNKAFISFILSILVTFSAYAQRVNEPMISFPSTFRGTTTNRIIGAQYLNGIFKKIADNKTPVRILQIGDSHIRGHIYPLSARRTLEASFGAQAVVPARSSYQATCIATETGQPGIVYSAIGINGATVLKFCNDDMVRQITAVHPDLIIVSFGTNESVGSFDEEFFQWTLAHLLGLIRDSNPNVTFLFTTPPGCYKNRQPVTTNERVADAICQYAEEHELAAWDLYEIGGGTRNTYSNWRDAGMMSNDQIHFTASGYTLQGSLLAEAFIKAYNKYVTSRR